MMSLLVTFSFFLQVERTKSLATLDIRHMLVDMRKYRFENVPREGKPCHLSVIHSKANPVTYLLYIAITIGVPAKIESSGLKPLNIKL